MQVVYGNQAAHILTPPTKIKLLFPARTNSTSRNFPEWVWWNCIFVVPPNSGKATKSDFNYTLFQPIVKRIVHFFGRFFCYFC